MFARFGVGDVMCLLFCLGRYKFEVRSWHLCGAVFVLRQRGFGV